MALGMKTGGRRPGVPNKRTFELADKLSALGIDPVAQLAQIVSAPDTPPELRARVACELLAYVYPKRRALDIAARDRQEVNIRIGLPAKQSGQSQPVPGI